jgi:hypothetical protein
MIDRATQSIAAKTLPTNFKVADENANARLDTGEFPLSAWTAAYPTATALLRELECPSFLDLVAGTSQWRSLCQDALAHWKELGHPEVSWQDAVEWECVQLFCKRLSIVLPNQVQP